MKLHKLACITSALVISSTAAANNMNINPDACDVRLNGSMQFQNNELTITTDSGKEITFNSNEQVYVDGKKLALSASEEANAGEYYEAVQKAVPLTVEIAIDGVELASDTLTEVFGELVGHDDSLVQDIDSLFADVRYELDQKFYNDEGGFVLNGDDLMYDGWAGNTWSNQFESRIDDITSKAVGKLMVSLGSALLFGGDGEATERLQNLENLDVVIEQKVEAKASNIEAKAEDLCVILEKADEAENALRYSNDELSDLNVIKFNKKHAK